MCWQGALRAGGRWQRAPGQFRYADAPRGIPAVKPIREAWLLLIPAVLGLLIAAQWPDIRRYLKIKQLSQGQGTPENVPGKGNQRVSAPRR